MRRLWMDRLLALGAALVLTLAMTGCGGDDGEPLGPTGSTGPDITGVVWQLDDNGDGTGSMLVVGLQGADGDYDRASVTVTKDTAWIVPVDGGTAPFGRDLVGRRVAVTFTGPVAESYPVQATASEVRLLEPLGVSQQVTTAGRPQASGAAVELVRDEAGVATALVIRPEGQPDTTRSIPLTAATLWLLATPSEFKTLPAAPLIGNMLEPSVDVHLEDGAAAWVAVMLPR